MYCMFALPPALYHLTLDGDILDLLADYSDRMQFADEYAVLALRLSPGVRLYIYAVCAVCLVILRSVAFAQS